MPGPEQDRPRLPSRAEIDREMIRRRGLHEFGARAWHLVEPARPYIETKLARAVCEFLESVNPGETAVVNEPPGLGKSRWLSVMFPAWHGGGFREGDPRFAEIPTRSARFLTTSYSDGLVRRDSLLHRNLVASSWYGELTGIGLATSEKSTETEWSTTSGGSRIATTAPSGSATGRHADVILVDDPTKPEDARAERSELEAIIRWWTVTMPSRTVRAARAIRIIVMQRLHELDLSGYELGHGARALVLPMRFEPEHPNRSALDWRTEPGELLAPELKDEADVALLETQMTPYAVAGQLQQRPSPEGGGMFRREHARTYRVLPNVPGQRVISLDATFKAAAGSDEVGLGCGFFAEGKLHLEDVVLDRLGFKATCDAVRAMLAAHKGVSAILVEDAANGPAIVEELEREIPGIVLVRPLGGKEARAHVSAAWWEAGSILMPEDAPWRAKLIEQHVGFPMAAHDDGVDMLSQMVNYLAAHSTTLYAAGVKRLRAAMGGRR